MSSPFAPFANITVVFQVPVNETEATNSTGNPAVTVQSLVCMAYVQREKLSRQQRQTPLGSGAELTEIRLEGHWIAPSQAPQNLAPEQAGEAYMWRVDSTFKLPQDGFASLSEYETFVESNPALITAEGRFIIASSPPNPFGVAEILGDAFQGYLITKTLWADEL